MTKKSRRGFTKVVLAWEILQIKKMLTEVLGRDPKSDALMRARGFDLKRRIKMIERYSVY
jgi:hypothetical protein